MLQHYSVSWKKGLAALCLLAVAGLSGCDQKENAAAKVEYDGLSNSQPLRVDANNHTVTMLVQINGRFLTDDTRHGIVFKDGSNGHKSLFMAYATPKALGALFQGRLKGQRDRAGLLFDRSEQSAFVK